MLNQSTVPAPPMSFACRVITIIDSQSKMRDIGISTRSGLRPSDFRRYYCWPMNNDNYTNDNDYDSDVLVLIILDARSADDASWHRRLSHLDFVI